MNALLLMPLALNGTLITVLVVLAIIALIVFIVRRV